MTSKEDEYYHIPAGWIILAYGMVCLVIGASLKYLFNFNNKWIVAIIAIVLGYLIGYIPRWMEGRTEL
jgi:tetrahydromethanopterin S-methyltransferase subunit C